MNTVTLAAPVRSTTDPASGSPTCTALHTVLDLPRPNAAPLVSIVIPCYKQARFLAAAIESTQAQTFRDLEVIVVDDGSPDDVRAVVAAYPQVRYVRQFNRGLAAARNAGLRHCRGELVVFLDADDRLLPHAIETGVALMTADPSLAFVAGHSRFISADGTALPTEQPRRGPEPPYLTLLRRNSIRNPAMVMFRRHVVERAGGFDSRVDACADYDLYLRISRTHPARFHDAVIAEYRKHGANMSGDAALMIRQVRVVMRRQRRHVSSRAHAAAFRWGRRNIQQYYGDRLATQIRQRVRAGSGWPAIASDLATLVWCHPRGAVEHACRKLVSWWRNTASPEPLA